MKTNRNAAPILKNPILFILMLSTFLNAQTPIAVIDFVGYGISQSESIALTNRLRNELFKVGTFQVLEREMMEEVLKEQGIQQTGCTTNECLVEVGKLIGVRQIVGGSISKVGSLFTVSVRIVDVESGQLLIVTDYDFEGNIEDLLKTGMRTVAQRLSDQSLGENQIGATPAIPSAKRGGIEPFVGSVCIGPRVGLEMNEGKSIEDSEWVGFAGPVVGNIIRGNLGYVISTLSRVYMAYDTGGKKNGVGGFLASYCIGPRIGAQLNERYVRTNEWLTFCCIGTCLIGMEAYQGKTMSEIEIAEGLRKR